MLANIDWYLLPVVNPDGYEYSMTTVSVQQLVVLTVSIKLSLFSGQGCIQDFGWGQVERRMCNNIGLGAAGPRREYMEMGCGGVSPSH